MLKGPFLMKCPLVFFALLFMANEALRTCLDEDDGVCQEVQRKYNVPNLHICICSNVPYETD
jgi:hypothetical protein